MNYLFWIVIILFSLLGLVVLIFLGVAYAMQSYMKPTTKEDSIHQIKIFLGYHFEDGYEFLEIDSKNYHPDRPLQVILKLNVDLMAKIESYLSTIEPYLNEKLNQKNNVKYIESVMKSDSCFEKTHTALNIISADQEIEFFIAKLKIDFKEKLLFYNETQI